MMEKSRALSRICRFSASSAWRACSARLLGAHQHADVFGMQQDAGEAARQIDNWRIAECQVMRFGIVIAVGARQVDAHRGQAVGLAPVEHFFQRTAQDARAMAGAIGRVASEQGQHRTAEHVLPAVVHDCKQAVADGDDGKAGIRFQQGVMALQRIEQGRHVGCAQWLCHRLPFQNECTSLSSLTSRTTGVFIVGRALNNISTTTALL
jgi:hypothetical protein